MGRSTGAMCSIGEPGRCEACTSRARVTAESTPPDTPTMHDLIPDWEKYLFKRMDLAAR